MSQPTVITGKHAADRIEQLSQLFSAEGGTVSIGVLDGLPCVLVDEGTMADFLDPEDKGLAGASVLVFDTEADRATYLQERRWPTSVEAAVDWDIDGMDPSTAELEEQERQLAARAANDEGAARALRYVQGELANRGDRRRARAAARIGQDRAGS